MQRDVTYQDEKWAKDVIKGLVNKYTIKDEGIFFRRGMSPDIKDFSSPLSSVFTKRIIKAQNTQMLSILKQS